MKRFNIQVMIGKEIMRQDHDFAMKSDEAVFSRVIDHVENKYNGDVISFTVELPIYVTEALAWIKTK